MSFVPVRVSLDFTDFIGTGIQDWFSDLADSIKAIFANFPTPLAVLFGVIVLFIVVRMVVNLL